jgi:hypothetical protein
MSTRRKVQDAPNEEAQKDSEISVTPLEKRGAVWRIYRCPCMILYLVLFVWFASMVFNMVRDVIPEMDLVINSNCKAPLQNWDGKVFNFPVWWSSYSNRPSYYNLHAENEYVGNNSNHKVYLQGNAGSRRPVIIFGTHHKTGTFLAKKLFSRICSKMNWCCLFHVTRDSVHALAAALQNEPVNALGHNQWIWNPRAIGLSSYRFVHFYRHPFKKIISGYRYHADGTEEWTKKPLSYNKLCSNPLVAGSGIGGGHFADNSTESLAHAVSSLDVWDFCASIHLCETCCRMEHERAVIDAATNSYTIKQVRRSVEEYNFMCKHLGSEDRIKLMSQKSRVDPSSKDPLSIQDMLLMQPDQHAVLTEAALDYYENLRMATIIHETAEDPHTLNIDIDDLNENFSDVTMRLLQHLKGVIPEGRILEFHEDLSFYDLQTSPIYRWSMTNPIVNHVTNSEGATSKKKAPANTLRRASVNGTQLLGSEENSSRSLSSKELLAVLYRDKSVMSLYSPIFELMKSVWKTRSDPREQYLMENSTRF